MDTDKWTDFDVDLAARLEKQYKAFLARTYTHDDFVDMPLDLKQTKYERTMLRTTDQTPSTYTYTLSFFPLMMQTRIHANGTEGTRRTVRRVPILPASAAAATASTWQ